MNATTYKCVNLLLLVDYAGLLENSGFYNLLPGCMVTNYSMCTGARCGLYCMGTNSLPLYLTSILISTSTIDTKYSLVE